MNNKLLETLNKIAAEHTAGETRRHAGHVPVPELPPRGPLSSADQWRSIIWSIDSAELHGEASLKGLALAFGKIIQADYLKTLMMDARVRVEPHSDVSVMLWEEDLPLTEKSETLRDLLSVRAGCSPLALSQTIVLSAPWVRYRLFRALENLGKNPFRQDSNHQATVWLPWPIVWVSNGYHSISVGAMYGSAILDGLDQYDASSLLMAVRPDGKDWLRTHDNSVIAPIHSLAMAAIFEIGRRLLDIHAQSPEPPKLS